MKNTELRIGNLANVNGIESIVYDVMCDGVSTKDFHCMGYENIHGIPLNESWLIRLGFEGKIDEWRLGSITLCEVGADHYIYQLQFEGKVCQVFVEYVHQLQNLYHALTGTEPNLKE